MSPPGRAGGIEISQDLDYERRSFQVRQIANVVIGLVLVAAALGLFGSGVVSDASVRSDSGGLSVDFDRFLRFGAPATVHVELRSGGSEENVSISRAYLQQFDVRSVKPEPESVTATPDRLVYTFKVEAPARVDFNLLPRHAGRHRGTVTLGGEESVSFSQWVYP